MSDSDFNTVNSHVLQPVQQESTGYEEAIPVIRETLEVSKQTVETGKIHISKTVNEQQETINVPLQSKQYEVVRIPVGQRVETLPPAVRYEGDIMIVSVVKEVLVVEKKYELVEELHITKRITETTETQTVTLRTEQVSIERTSADKEEISQ
jgi:uncharacterized protein (TIGR02271 family)